MNQSQIKYARERAEKIKRSLLSKNAEKFKAKQLSDEERVKALKEGRFEVIAKKGSRLIYVSEVIRFEGETPEDGKGREKGAAAIEAAYVKLMDELVLGDAEEALAQLRGFEALEG